MRRAYQTDFRGAAVVVNARATIAGLAAAAAFATRMRRGPEPGGSLRIPAMSVRGKPCVESQSPPAGEDRVAFYAFGQGRAS